MFQVEEIECRKVLWQVDFFFLKTSVVGVEKARG